MNEVILKDFRCFHKEQAARLAPLTILVGNNSTGKTSFLAVIKALWDAFYRQRVPNFKEDPYDLGSFYEIAHYRGAGGGRATTFEAGFKISSPRKAAVSNIEFRMRLKESQSAPIVYSRSLSNGSDTSITEVLDDETQRTFHLTTSNGSWDVKIPNPLRGVPFDSTFIPSTLELLHMLTDKDAFRQNRAKVRSVGNSRKITRKDQEILRDVLLRSFVIVRDFSIGAGISTQEEEGLFAGAPVRSKPRRTYDPANLEQDAEGENIPTYLANVRSRDPNRWESLKKRIESFGKSAGLFDEINIKLLGRKGGAPFQVQIRKFGDSQKNAPKGPSRNLIDVGYGVSQVLPVVTELLRADSHSMFLLQQPEVHLHPSAQAALGDLFCQVAGPKGHQMIIETHSDYLLDRIRMAVRYGTTKLKPDDVSILFFERQGLGVRIHSLRLDEQGSIVNAPLAYRKFFMEEESRRLQGFQDVRDT